MNLEQKIGQLLIVGFTGDTVSSDSPVIRDIRKRNLGGVILFDRFLARPSKSHNIIDHHQVQRLIDALQDSAATPLLVAVDQEGGRVNRFKAERGFPQTPPAAKLGCLSDTAATTAAAEATARLLAELGFNLNLAPVVDLDSFANNPIIGRYQRSFHREPARVVAHATAWVNAHRRHGVKTCLKHFPGHGSARDDSHLGFVDVSNFWHRDELIPYRTLIDTGLADAIMTGHLFNRHLDPSLPATMSRETVAGLLRGELGYQGPVISDDMQMGAITGRYPLAEAVAKAITAGVDLLVFGNNLDYNPDITDVVIQAAVEAVRDGRLAEQAVEQAWQRVQQLKRDDLVKSHQ